MKHCYAALLLLLPFSLQAQAPAGYYNPAYGNSGEALRVALYNIIKGHTVLTYTPGLWDAYHTTDVKPNGKLATIYSDKPGSTPPYEFTIGTNQCSGSSPSGEGGCYNREHIWPQSKFGSNYPMYSDLWIVYPTDYYVNSQRGDLPYGKVSAPTKTFQNGGKLGPNTYSGAPTSGCLEPIDSFKGDIARSYFYITTRYLGDSATFQDWEMAIKSRLKPWAIQMLLEWHHNDPVSKKEIDRNNAAYALQNNRNPFIDEPRFADCIWAGNCLGLNVASVAAITSHIHIAPNPAANEVRIDWSDLAPDEVLAIDMINMQGQLLYHQPNQRANTAVIPLKDFARGFYMLRLQTKGGTSTQRLILQ